MRAASSGRFAASARARSRSWYFALSAFLLLTVAGPAHAAPPGEEGVRLRQAGEALMELRIEAASATLDAMVVRYPDDPDVRFEHALSLFYRGRYGEAVSALDAVDGAPALRTESDRDALGALIRDTHAATEHFVRHVSHDGRFVVLHAPGSDTHLVGYAIDAMRAADAILSEAFGIRVEGPIRLEFYPSAASLARVSSLTEEEIATTGTIALCKWDRVMVTSPRALLRGYPWVDTIGHELVHLFLARASRDRAPVWLQEGVAKFMERTWRGIPPSAALDPSSEGMLRQAVVNQRLLPFDRLHPSIARLPSQEDAALAFAQVATFVERFHSEHGADGLRRAIAAIARGRDAREALADVAEEPFSEMEREWRASLRDRPAPEAPPRMLSMRLRSAASLASGDEASEERQEVEDAQARRHLRLGDLLWDRAHPRGAAVEYQRAHERAPDDPIVASRFARAALTGGTPTLALQALSAMRERYPEHAPTWALSGAAWLSLGQLEQAREALREAIRLNPFDPEPHCGLARASESEREVRREETICSALSRH